MQDKGKIVHVVEPESRLVDGSAGTRLRQWRMGGWGASNHAIRGFHLRPPQGEWQGLDDLRFAA